MSVQDQLRELFGLDQQIRGLRSRVDASTRRLHAQRTKLEQLQRQASELSDELKHAQASSANLASDVTAIDERIEKVRQTMSGVRSNKEYSALLVEVNTLKLEKTKREDKQLEAMTRVEELQARVGEVQAKAADQEKLVEGAQTEVTQGEAEIAEQLGTLEAERLGGGHVLRRRGRRPRRAHPSPRVAPARRDGWA